MERKFKYGDKVKIKRTGQTGVVLGVSPRVSAILPYWVWTQDDKGVWDVDMREDLDLELAPPEPFKVGDVVRVRGDCTIAELRQASKTAELLASTKFRSEECTVSFATEMFINLEGHGDDVYTATLFELVRHAPDPKDPVKEAYDAVYKALDRLAEVLKEADQDE